LVDGADLIAMCLESGPVAARRKLLGEFVRSLDCAVSICGDRPIWLARDAIKESTALRIGLRPRRLGIVYQFGYALRMSPLLMVLRAFTKGRGYTLCVDTRLRSVCEISPRPKDGEDRRRSRVATRLANGRLRNPQLHGV